MALLLLLWMTAHPGLPAARTLRGGAAVAQTDTGELRLTVTDPAGLPVQSDVELVSESNQVRQHLATDAGGMLVARRLPFGAYRVLITRDGFTPFSGLFEIRSALPTEFRATLGLAPVQAQIAVTADTTTLIDLRRTTASNRIGVETLQRRTGSLPGRSLLEMVNTQPGWLLEANGILHPRGSEYQVQYIVDGLPLTDNRSPAFAPSLEADGVQSMNVLTAGYPAEYGRKLGGVVEVVTAGDARDGIHGGLVASGGSFGTASGGATVQYSRGPQLFGITANAARTDRFLDPPVEENYTNGGWTSNLAIHLERGLSPAHRIGAIVRRGQSRFLVPNERVQEEAGQRQDRASRETAVQVSYQRIFSSGLIADVRAMARDLSAELWSNRFATPILVEQQRGFRDVYVKGTVAGHRGAHEWKVGVDANVGSLDEAFAYEITNPDPFDDETAPAFRFSAKGSNREHALFAQDRVRVGPWTINAGLRWDRYRLMVEEQALSPRLGIAWAWPEQGLVVRGSFDRAFQTPAIENLLLASSPAVDSLSAEVLRLPVRPSRGNFFEVGASKSLFGRLRVDGNLFVRDLTELADDDVLFNTGISFPIAFERARISGAELKLEVPPGRRLSGFVSYANMRGTGYLPITGGLLLDDDEAAELLTSTDSFPISQDQRHTFRGRAMYQVTPAAWLAASASYGSGLPVEIEGDPEDAVAQYGSRIVDRVDLAQRRVRPTFSLDLSAGATLVRARTRSLRVQADVLNLTNRLNVINFAGLFSGTAIGPPRSVAVRFQFDY
jgi:hypothetical protein